MSVTSRAVTTLNTIKNAGRFKTIVGVFAKHGFSNIVERARLGRYILTKFTSSDLEKLTVAERLRMSFEELGPTFVKLGQLLATRPDLIPPAFCEEFKKLHDQVPSVSFDIVQQVLEDHFESNIESVFASFDTHPIGAASIAQVYKATLKTGEPVVVKVQRPGIVKLIYEDLNVLYAMAELMDAYIPEVRVYNPVGIVDEFFKSLELETNFIVEANNIRRFQANFEGFPNIKIPEVYFDLTGSKVLVMEKLEGMPLSQPGALDQPGVDKERLIKTGIQCYFKMVFKDGLFHGDMHPGNLFILPDGELGLIDFGQVGRLNSKTKWSISNMMVALATEDYERFAYEYIDLAPYSDHADVDVLARQIRNLLSPYFGLHLGDVNTGRLLMETTSIAAENNLKLPSELVLFFKSIINIEFLGKMIKKDFDVLEYALEFATEIITTKYDPSKIAKDFSTVARDTNSLLSIFPRHFKQILRRWNSPDHILKISLSEIKDLRFAINHSASLLFLGLIIGCLILSSSLIVAASGSVDTLPLISVVGYSLAGAISALAVVNYIRR